MVLYSAEKRDERVKINKYFRVCLWHNQGALRENPCEIYFCTQEAHLPFSAKCKLFHAQVQECSRERKNVHDFSRSRTFWVRTLHLVKMIPVPQRNSKWRRGLSIWEKCEKNISFHSKVAAFSPKNSYFSKICLFVWRLFVHLHFALQCCSLQWFSRRTKMHFWILPPFLKLNANMFCSYQNQEISSNTRLCGEATITSSFPA